MTQIYRGDHIYLTGLVFHGHHGVLPAEAELGQRFVVDLDCGVDLEPAGRTDAVADTVSYAEIYEVVAETFAARRRQLLESLAQDIVASLFAAFPRIVWIEITLHKPAAPIAMTTGRAAIRISRWRVDG